MNNGSKKSLWGRIFALVLSLAIAFSIAIIPQTALAADAQGVCISGDISDPKIGNGNTSRNIAVSADGTVYVVLYDSEAIYTIKSTDGGKTFSSPTAAVTFGEGNVEPEIAVSSNGNVYISYIFDGKIMFTKSTDNGKTFSAPKSIAVISEEYGKSLHMAIDGDNVYVITSSGISLFVSKDNGDSFTEKTIDGDPYAYSDVMVDTDTHEVIIQKDKPEVIYYIYNPSTDTFGDCVDIRDQVGVFFSVSSFGKYNDEKYFITGGTQEDSGTFKIDLNTGKITQLTNDPCPIPMARSIVADKFGNVATGFSDGEYVYFQVSGDGGKTFSKAVKVAQSQSAKAMLNPLTGDLIFLYTSEDGKIYVRGFADQLPNAGNYVKAGKVKFVSNGSEVAALDLDGNNKVDVSKWPADPTREGFAFLGWYDAETGGNKVDASTSFAGISIVYAHWGAIESSVTIKPGAPTTTLNNSASELMDASGIFTPEEKAQIQAGTSAKVWLEVAPPENIDSADMNKAEAKAKADLGSDVKLNFVDLALWKKVGNKQETLVPEPGINISVTITIPEELRAPNREYYIVRVHEGVAGVIKGTLDKATYNYTFETDRFSTYAIAYKTTDDIANTSDNSMSLVWFGVACVAGCGAFVINERRKESE